MSWKNDQQLKLKDVRKVSRLIGECCELGSCPRLWQTRFVDGLRKMIGFQGATVAIVEGAPGDPNSSLRLCLETGWTDDEQRSICHSYWKGGYAPTDPTYLAFRSFDGPLVVQRRQDLCRDRIWYGSVHFNEFYRRANLDSVLLATVRSGCGRRTLVHAFNFLRALNDRPYSEHDRRIVRFALREMRGELGKRLTVYPPAGTFLAPRQQEILLLLTRGLQEKEVAHALGLSTHTVHSYIKDMHRRLGVSTRGELLAASASVISSDSGDADVSQKELKS